MIKILHIMSEMPEKYNSKFYDFFESYNSKKYNSYYLPLVVKKNINKKNKIDLSCKNTKTRIISLLKHLCFKKNEIIIFHGFFYNWKYLLLIYFSFLIINRRKKIIWQIWGGDLYFYKNKTNSLNDRFTEYLRKKVIPKFHGISALTDGETELVSRIYNFKRARFNAFYPLPAEFHKYIDIDISNEYFRISNSKYFIVGNSGDPTNNHIEIIDKLYKLNYNEFLYFPLAYGNIKYINEVILYAQKKFPKKCYFQTHMVHPEQYNFILLNSQGGIFNHNRQQGLGNILTLLYYEKIVFMRDDVLSFKDLTSRGIKLFNIDNLKEINNNIRGTNNKKLILENFSEIKAFELWDSMLQGILHEKNK